MAVLSAIINAIAVVFCLFTVAAGVPAISYRVERLSGQCGGMQVAVLNPGTGAPEAVDGKGRIAGRKQTIVLYLP